MERIPLPAHPDDITAGWMRQALAAGRATDVPEIDALEVEQLLGVTNALGNLFRCRVVARDGGAAGPASVIVKLPTSNSIALRLARWMALHRREYVYYRDVAPRSQVRVPSLYYGDLDTRTDRFVLVMEDLGGMEAIPQGVGVGVERARRAVRGIARFQGGFWEAAGDPALADCGVFLTAGQSRIMQTIYLLTLAPALERFGDLFTADARRRAEAFGSRIEAHFATVSKGPKTIVHGDYRGDNVLFGGDDPDGLAVIDWQGCGLGCGMYDVAFFLATSVAVEDRRRLERDALDEYHDIVCGMGARNYSRDDCWRSYRQNILGALMPMVIGAGAWK